MLRDILTAGQKEGAGGGEIKRLKWKMGLHDINAMVLKISAKIFEIPRAREKKGG